MGYFRTWYGNIRVTNNLAVSASDFSSYCITAPLEPLLPGGGGQQVCGFYDVNPNKFGASNQLVDLASNYGNPSEVFNGVDVSLTARLGGGRFVQAGLSTGSTMTDNCYANDQAAAAARRQVDIGPEDGRVLQSQHSVVGRHPVQSRGGVAAVVATPGERELSEHGSDRDGGERVDLECRRSCRRSSGPGGVRRAHRRGVHVEGRRPISCSTNTYYLEPRFNQLDLRFSRSFRLPGGATHSAAGRLLQHHELERGAGDHHAVGARPSTSPTTCSTRGCVKFGVNMTF